MGKHLFQLRFFDAEADYEMVADWFACHGEMAPLAAVLPKLGVVCEMDGEAVAALWLYMDNSTGVCWAEYPVTRPKLKLSQTKAALTHLFNYLRMVASSNNYALMRVTTIKPIARFLEKMGFKTDRANLVSMVGATKLEEEQ